ncbi:MAG: hypothetical protein JWM89_3435 [Acidimicrobiales bacterium]|nr:hypothetical protein [Acidimicrobiales bacterium]
MTTYLTASQAARILGLSAERVRQLATAGTLPCVETPLGRLFDADEVDRLHARRQPKGDSGPTLGEPDIEDRP